jgi:hypothetical protein
MIPASYDPPGFLLDGIPLDGGIQALWRRRGMGNEGGAKKGAEDWDGVVSTLFYHNRRYFVVNMIDFFAVSITFYLTFCTIWFILFSIGGELYWL